MNRTTETDLLKLQKAYEAASAAARAAYETSIAAHTAAYVHAYATEMDTTEAEAATATFKAAMDRLRTATRAYEAARKAAR